MPGRQEPCSQRPAELLEGAPPGCCDLARVVRDELLVRAARQEDVRSPLQLSAAAAEDGRGGDEVPAQLDLQSRLLERLTYGTGDEILAGPDAAAGRSPDAGFELRLADQREPVRGIED